MKLFLDGANVHEPTSDIPSQAYSTTHSLRIGIDFDPAKAVKHFNGLIDEVRIYNRSLSGDEIYRQYIRSKYTQIEPAISFGPEEQEYTPPLKVNASDITDLAGIVTVIMDIGGMDPSQLTITTGSQTWMKPFAKSAGVASVHIQARVFTNNALVQGKEVRFELSQ